MQSRDTFLREFGGDKQNISRETHKVKIRFQDKENKVDLTFDFEEEDVPSKGDAHVQIAVSSHGFGACNNCWIQADIIQGFFDALLTLKTDGLGEAQLTSISPGELELKVCSMNQQTHISVSGKTTRLVCASTGNFHQSLAFAFAIEPGLLKDIVASIVR